jgi:large subunit ribosomal protein L25
MSKASIQIAAAQRSQLGSRANQRLRESGKVPGVIYGHKEAVVPLTLPKKELVHHLSNGAHVFDLQLDGKSEKVLVKEVQYDHLGLEVLHVDFARVSLDERSKSPSRSNSRARPRARPTAACFSRSSANCRSSASVTDIPDVIVHNVSEMEKDSVLHISDLKLPPNVRVHAGCRADRRQRQARLPRKPRRRRGR